MSDYDEFEEIDHEERIRIMESEASMVLIVLGAFIIFCLVMLVLYSLHEKSWVK